MRTIVLDMTADRKAYPTIFGGYVGEHNATRLEVKLPSRLISPDINLYRFSFETARGEVVHSLPCSITDGIVSVTVWKQLTTGKDLKVAVCGFSVEGDVTNLVEKTGAVTLKLDDAIDGQEVDANIFQEYSESEFEKMLQGAVDKAKSYAQESKENVNKDTVREAGSVMGVYNGDKESEIEKDEDGYITVPHGNGSEQFGTVKLPAPENRINPGLSLIDGTICIVAATDEEIKNRHTFLSQLVRSPITTANLDYAVTSALCDGKSAPLSEPEQESAQKRIGVYDLLRSLQNTVAALSGKAYYNESNDSDETVKHIPENVYEYGYVDMSEKRTIIANQLCNPETGESNEYITNNKDGTYTVQYNGKTSTITLTPVSAEAASGMNLGTKTLSDSTVHNEYGSYSSFDLGSNTIVQTDSLGEVLCCETWRSSDFTGIKADIGTYDCDYIDVRFSICFPLGSTKFNGRHKVIANIGAYSVEFVRNETWAGFDVTVMSGTDVAGKAQLYGYSGQQFDKLAVHSEIISMSGATKSYTVSGNYPDSKLPISIRIENYGDDHVSIVIKTQLGESREFYIEGSFSGKQDVSITNLVKNGSGYICDFTTQYNQTCEPLIEAGHKVLLYVAGSFQQQFSIGLLSRTGHSLVETVYSPQIAFTSRRVDRISMTVPSPGGRNNIILPLVIDLTKLFGKGNEPATIDELYQYFGDANLEKLAKYSTGTPVDVEVIEAISMDIDGNIIDTVKNNGSPGSLIRVAPCGTVVFEQNLGTKVPLKTVLLYQVKTIV